MNPHRRLDLEPRWVEDVLGLWAVQSIAKATEPLGHSNVSPMFKRCAVAWQSEDVEGYSSAEMAAMGAAVDRLLEEHPDEWAAIQRAFKPWTRAGIDGNDNRALLLQAGQRLAAWVDQAMGD